MAAPAFKLDSNDDVLAENRERRRARIHRPRWEPKKWHPVYEEIVLLDALGYKNTEIAKEKGFTTVHISNILCTEQAKMLKEILVKRLRKKGVETFEQRLERYADKAMDRIEEVLENDEYAAKNPGGIFDRAITMLKATGKVKEPEKDGVRERVLMVPAEMMEGLRRAIELSDEARRLNRLAAPGAESIDTTVLGVVEEPVDG